LKDIDPKELEKLVQKAGFEIKEKIYCSNLNCPAEILEYTNIFCEQFIMCK